MTTQSSMNRIVVYKGCRYHSAEFARRVDDREADCVDCRKATFRASMKARGITVNTPKCKSPYPDCRAYNVGTNLTVNDTYIWKDGATDELRLDFWRRNCFVSSMS